MLHNKEMGFINPACIRRVGFIQHHADLRQSPWMYIMVWNENQRRKSIYFPMGRKWK